MDVLSASPDVDACCVLCGTRYPRARLLVQINSKEVRS